MVGERLKVIIKWGGLLVVVSAVLLFGISFLIGILAALLLGSKYDQQLVTIAAILIAAIGALPFSYLFPYKATMEYLRGGKSRYQKNIGFNIGIGVIAVAALIGMAANFLLTGQFNISLGLIPLILGFLAGRNAEKQFFG